MIAKIAVTGFSFSFANRPMARSVAS